MATKVWDRSPILRHLIDIKAIDNFHERLQDELKSIEFPHVSKPGMYDDPTPFGADAAARFPSATDDINNAAKCFALGLCDVTIFDLIGIMQVALRSVAKALKASIDPRANWETTIKAVEPGTSLCNKE